MKKIYFFLMMLVALCLAGTVQAQSTLTVHDGEATSQIIPLYGWNADHAQYNQILYPASDLSAMNGMEITQMVFYFDSNYGSSASSVETGSLGNWTISLGETTASTLTSTNTSTPLSQVYQGIMAWDHTALTLTITFDNGYVYNGGNLLIEFDHSAASGYNKYYFLGDETSDPASFNSYTYTSYNFLPKLTFSYRTPPTCSKPTNVTLSFVNNQMAYFTWDEVPGANWQIDNVEYGETPAWTGSTIANHEGGTTGLTATTHYDFYVRQYCSATEQSEPVKVSYWTKCDPITTFPWNEDFESMTISTVPECWDNSASTSSTLSSYPERIWGVYNYNSNNMLRMYNYYVQSGTALINSPTIVLPSEGEYQLTFNYSHLANCGDFTVKISEDGGTTFANLGTYSQTSSSTNYTNPGEFTEAIPISLSAYAGKSVILQFNASANYSSGAIFVDDITIDLAPACSKPTGLHVVNGSLTAHTVTVEWDADEDAMFQALMPAGTFDPNEPPTNWNVQAQTENTANWNSLTQDRDYGVWLRKWCSETDQSEPVYVTFHTPIACLPPSDLTATLTSGNGTIADLSWTENGTATNWVLEYGTTEDFTGATSVNVSGTPSAHLTGLTAETTYYARIKADCGSGDGQSEWSTETSFTPTDAYFLTVNDGTSTNNYVPVYGYYCDDYSRSQFIIPAANLAAMQYGNIHKMTFYSSNANISWGDASFKVYLSETSENTISELNDWDDLENVYTGTLSISDNQMVVTFDNPYQYLGGNLLVGTNQTVSGDWKSCSWYGISATGASLGGHGTTIDQKDFLPKTTFEYTPSEVPTCSKPSALNVDYTGGTTAMVTWTSEATSFNLDVNGTVTNNVTSPYTLTDLTLGTTYTIKVQTDCGTNGTSDWTVPTSFTTDFCQTEDQCAITLVLTDRYGDGWNGNAIQVVDVLTESVLGVFTNEDLDGLTSTEETQTLTLNVCHDRDIQFQWIAGNYAGETSYAVLDPNGYTIFSGANTMAAPVTYTVNCSSITTPCDAIVVTEETPFTEGFEGTTMPDCWILIADVATEDVWTLNEDPTETHTGTGCALAMYNEEDITKYLISPALTLPTDAPTQLSFWSYNGDSEYYSKNSVLISTTGINANDFTEIWSPTSVTETWDSTGLSLADYAGQTIYIAFKYEGEYAHYWLLDDIMVSVNNEIPVPSCENWELVTDNSLEVGDQIVIASLEQNVAMSTTQNNNNRGVEIVTKNMDNTLGLPLDEAIQILTLEEGTSTGTFALYTGDGYLYAAGGGSNNYLRTESSLDNNGNGNWAISVSNDGTASIVAQGTATRKVMQYNQDNSIISCYASANQSPLAIYKLTNMMSYSDTTATVAGTEFAWHGKTYYESGIYGDTLTGAAANGCDSVVLLHLTLEELTYNVMVTTGHTEGTIAADPTTAAEGTIITLTATSEPGYHFGVWLVYDADENTIPVTGNTFAMPASDVTVDALFLPNTYSLVLEVMQGTLLNGFVRDNEYTFGQGFTLPTADDVEYEGHTFGGWYSNYEFEGDPMTEISTDAYGDTTVYAKWTVNTYTISATVSPANAGTVEGTGEFEYGSSTTLSATPAEGYLFSSWTLNGEVVSTNAAYDIVWIDADAEYVANFVVMGQVAAPTFTPAAGEYDSENIPEISLNCTTDGATIYYTTDGSEPTASSAVYSTPINITGTTTIKAIAMKDEMLPSEVAEATYTINQVYNVTVVETDFGSIGAEPLSGVEGTTITLSSTPDLGYFLKNWIVTDANNTPVEVTDNTFNMPASDVFVTALFVPDTFTVTVVVDPEAGGTVTSGAGRYAYDEDVTIVYEANPGYELLYIGTTVEGGTEEESDDQFSMPAGDVTVTLHFEPATYDLTLEVMQGTLLNGYERDNQYTFGQGFTLPTVDDVEYEGHTFGGWYSNYEFEGDPMTEISTDAYGDTTVFAKWTVNIYTISASVNPTNGGSVEGTGQYEYGSDATLIATPNEGFLFSNWTLDGEVVSTNNIYDIIFIEDNAAYVANFVAMGTVATPVINPNGGTFDSENIPEITISCATEDATIYYTTDGSEPTENSSVYRNNPITITGTTTIKAIAVVEDMLPSEVATATFTINQVYVVTVEETDFGSIGAEPLSGVEGTTITLSATPDLGYFLKNWIVTDANNTPVEVTADNTFNMPASDVFVTALFVPDTFTVTVVVDPTAGGTVIAGGGRYAYGDEVDIEFEANPGYLLAYIGMAMEGEGEQESDNVFSMPAGNVTVTLYFEPATYNLTLEAMQGTLLNGFVRDNEYTFGEGFILPTADDVEYEGHTFGGWYSNYEFEGDPMTEISTDAYGDTTVFAKWTPNDYTLTIHYQFTDETQAAPDYSAPVTYNTEYSVESPTVEGYTPDQAVVSGIMPAENVEVTVTYGNDFFPLTIHYLYPDNTPAHDDVVGNYAFGSDYEVASPAIANYMPDQVVVAGTMGSSAVEVTVNYILVEMNAVDDIIICNGGFVPAIAFSSSMNIGEMSYEWTSDTQLPINNGADAGEGDIESFQAIITGNEPLVATITVTPTCTYQGMVVTGVPQVFTITVNPSLTSEFSITACDEYSWTEAHMNIRVEGTHDYVYHFETAEGCDSIVTLHLTLYKSPADVAADITDNTSCDAEQPNGVITVTSPAGEGYEFALDDGEWQSTAEFTGLAAGTYNVSARTVGSECVKTIAVVVSDNVVMPVVTASTDNTFYCVNGTITLTGEVDPASDDYEYAWTGPNNYSATTLNPDPMTATGAEQSGTYTLTVTNTVTGCTAESTVEVVVNEPNTPGYEFTITVNGDAYANINEGETEATVVLAEPTVHHFLSDCNWTLTNNSDENTYDAVNDYTVTWTATDDCGNTTTATQIVHVTQGACSTPVDGNNNSYPTVQMGGHCWMAANLKATKYTDGRDITGVYRYQSPTAPNADENVSIYGLLYDWYGAMDAERPTRGLDVQGACPTGWHIPDEDDFAALSSIDLYTLRSTNYWLIDAGDNSTGFNMLPAGQYNDDKARYENLLGNAYFWSATSTSESQATCHMADCNCYMWYVYPSSKNYGYSIRCVKNE